MTSSLPAMAFAGLLVLLSLFQLALAAGAPLGHFAWGGKHRVLPSPLRLGSLVSILLYALMTVVVLSKAAVIDAVPDGVATIGTWAVAAYCLVGIAMNAISKSMPERFTMVPVATMLFLLSLSVALGG
ncbi:MAG: hypothetical protein EOP19_04585 [Hyphomicrobiales bacterium]|nr:MAG: hypothetical protein EOP19_04585 [Hyphomicrobiales bacterium]